MSAPGSLPYYYDEPRVVEEWIRRYETMTPRERRRFDANLQFIGSAGRLPGAARVLSVGAGTGDYEIRLPVRVICVDLSLPMCRVQKHKGLTAVRGAAHLLPFKESQFGLVLAINLSSLHYGPAERQPVLAEFRRVLRKNGRLVLITANERWVRFSSLRRSGDPNKDEYRVHPGRLARELRALGFHVVWGPRIERLRMEPRNALPALVGWNLLNAWTVTLGVKLDMP